MEFLCWPIYGVKISGYESYFPIFSTVEKINHSLINDGGFGFEGGLPMTILLTLMMLVILYLIKSKIEKNKGIVN